MFLSYSNVQIEEMNSKTHYIISSLLCHKVDLLVILLVINFIVMYNFTDFLRESFPFALTHICPY